MIASRLSTSPDWVKLVAVLVFGAVLALIGSAVADGFLTAETRAPVSAITTTSTPVSTTTLVTETAGAAAIAGSGATTTTQRQPGALVVSEQSVDFGDTLNSVTVELEGTGPGSATWAMETEGTALSITPSSGVLGSGELAALEVSIDRSQIPEGEYSGLFTITWDGGSLDVTVAALSMDNPVIHNPRVDPSTVQAQSGSSCSPTRTTLSARIRDTSEIDSVLARWTDGGSTVEVAMTPAGEDNYEARIGPFSTVGTASVKVIAYDVLGNAGGASVSLTVIPCP